MAIIPANTETWLPTAIRPGSTPTSSPYAARAAGRVEFAPGLVDARHGSTLGPAELKR
ncbi:hypothetical protein [Kribbella catacumbae]|uniref:hypothetical protein n=1 Tax=Kribbella catacumbae TaxID=460086 RepID=UPI00037D5DC0|nr:hypothetical protein [Kribbella catacumbae]